MQEKKREKQEERSGNVLETIQVPQSSQEGAEELKGRLHTVLFLLCHVSHAVGFNVLSIWDSAM